MDTIEQAVYNFIKNSISEGFKRFFIVVDEISSITGIDNETIIQKLDTFDFLDRNKEFDKPTYFINFDKFEKQYD